MAMLSILGLYNYDNSIFDKLVLPSGVDRETLVENLCMELAELEILYANPDFMRSAIGAWSRKEFPAWVKLYKTTTFEYDPICNYDRTEIWEDDNKITSENSGNSKSTDKTKVAGFNSDSLVDSGESGNASEYSNSNTDTIKNKRTGRAYGNIGVTTTQQMIDEERRVAVWSIYDHIINSFKNRFCILVY